MMTVRRRSRGNSIPRAPELQNLIDLTKYDLNKEIDRRNSFYDNNWSNRFINGEDLAIVGFYFLKRPDAVRCAFCHVTINNFEQNDVALREHFKYSPNCPLLLRRLTDNVPIDESELDKLLPILSYDECGSTSKRKMRRRSKAEDNVAYPDYRLLSQRLDSFKRWPVGIKQRPEELAEAGFFYGGQSDLVACFSCGLFLCQWSPQDNVWVEHMEHATDECNHLKLNHETVKMNKEKYEEEVLNMKSNEGNTAEKDNFESEANVEEEF